MNIFSILQTGNEYMKKWPLEPLLNPVFPENRVKMSMTFANRIIPPFIFIIVLWDLYLGGWFQGIPLYIAIQSNIYMTCISIVLLLSLPLQGIVWFYIRSQSKLNDKQLSFYRNACKALDKEALLSPNMMDLEATISVYIKKFGTEILKDL